MRTGQQPLRKACGRHQGQETDQDAGHQLAPAGSTLTAGRLSPWDLTGLVGGAQRGGPVSGRQVASYDDGRPGYEDTLAPGQ